MRVVPTSTIACPCRGGSRCRGATNRGDACEGPLAFVLLLGAALDFQFVNSRWIVPAELGLASAVCRLIVVDGGPSPCFWPPRR